MSTKKVSNSNEEQTDLPKQQKIFNKLSASLQFFRKKLFPTQNEILDQQLRTILKAYNANDKQEFFRLISQFEKRRNVPFELTYYVLDTRKFFSTLLRDITKHPADKEIVIRIVDALISSFENVSRERALKLLRFYQLLSCFDVNFVQVFTAKGGYEVLNKLILKWNDEEFLTSIVVVLGSTIMFISKPKVEQYHSLKENIIDHAARSLESKSSVEFIVQTLILLFFTPDSILNYERAVHLGIQAMNTYPNNRIVLHAAYFLLAIRIKELFTKFAPKLKDVLRPLFTNDLIHVTKNPPVPKTSYILDESAQLLLSPEYTNRSQVPELQTTELFFLEMAFNYLQQHDSPEELKYFLDNRIFALIINEVKNSYSFAAFPFRALRAATKFMPTVYYTDIVNLTKKIMLSESAIPARHTCTVLFSTLQFMDEDVIRSTAEETVSTVFDKIDKNIKDKRTMLAGVTLLRLYFSISSSAIVEQIIQETGTSVFLNMIKHVIADNDRDRMVEVLIMLKESATFSPRCREFFVSEKFIMSAIDIINAFLGHAEVLNKLIRLFVNSVSQYETLFNQLFESPIFAYVTSIMARYQKEENILDAGCKFLATYGLYELGRKSAHSLNIIRQLYDIIKDMDSPVVIESALFTLVHFLSGTPAKSEHTLEDSQYELLSRRLATALCIHQDRPEMFKNASKVLYFMCLQGKGHNIKEEHVKDILEGLDAYRTQPIDGSEMSLSHIIAMLLTVTSLPSMKENPLNDKAYDFIMDVVKNNLDEAFRLRFFMALSDTQITTNTENVTRLMDRGVLPILLEYIEQHLKHEQLGFAHNVMAKLCAIPENIPTVADHGMPLIFRSFQEQKNNDMLHHYGLKALAMMSQSDAIKRRFGRVSIALTLETMSTFIDIPEIVINGTVALFNLAVGSSPSVRIDMHTLHGIHTLMKILRHRLPMVVKNNVILLLRVLCSYDENCIDFLEENGLEELLNVAKQFPEEKSMIGEILVTIGVVVEAEYKNSQLLDYLKKSGEYIIQFARNALKMSLEIKTRAANLLSDLSFHNFLVSSILSNGGLGAVLDCYTMHADDVALVANVLRLLLNCSRTDAFYNTVSLATVNTIIIPMMMTHLDDHLNDEETSFNQMYPAGFFANLIQFGGDYNKWHLDIPQLASRILVVIEKHSSHAQLLYHCFRLIRDLAKEPRVVPIIAEKLDVLMSKLKDKNFNIEALQAAGMELMAQVCSLDAGLNQFVILNGSEWMEQIKTEYSSNQRIGTAYDKITKALHK